MKTAVAVSALALLLAAGSVQAGVFRCADAKGRTYFSDKGCNPGDTEAAARGGGTVSIVGGDPVMKSRAAALVPQSPVRNSAPASGQAPAKHRFIQRAENLQQQK